MKLIAQLTTLAAYVLLTFLRYRSYRREHVEDRALSLVILGAMTVLWFWLLWEAGTFSELT